MVDSGEYRDARVYGHVAQIDMSGRVKGRTSMMLRFDRLVMAFIPLGSYFCCTEGAHHPKLGISSDAFMAIR